MDAKQLEDTLRSSNFIYEKAFKAGHDAGYTLGYREAMAACREIIDKVFDSKPAKQAG